jgi:hypothetical protein
VVEVDDALAWRKRTEAAEKRVAELERFARMVVVDQGHTLGCQCRNAMCLARLAVLAGQHAIQQRATRE